MADPLELIAVEVSANLDRLETQMQGSARIVDVNTQKIVQSVERAEQSIVRSSDNAGEALTRTGGASRQVAVQFSQMGQQVLTGTSPLQALAIQLPDLAVVMGQTGAEAGKLASFFGGPWGIALTTAAAFAIPLIASLFDTEDALHRVGDAAADAAKKLHDSLNTASLASNAATESTAKLINGMGAVAKVNREIADATQALSVVSRSFGGAEAAQGINVQLAILYRRKAAAEKEVSDARRQLDGIASDAKVAQMQASAAEKQNDAPDRPRRTRARAGKTDAEREAEAAAKAAAAQDKLYDKTKNQMELEQLLASMRGEGNESMSKMADKLEVIARIQTQFPELANSTLEADKERLQVLYDIATATIDEAYGRKSAKDAAEKQAKAEKDAQDSRKKAADELARRQEDQVRSLANLYEDAFRGGTKAIWQDFKDMGLRVVAEVLARFAVAKLNGQSFDLGSAIGSAVGSVLPGFATGGSMRIGGRGGTDNNTLSMNGRPIARVSAGEELSIVNPNLSGGGSRSAPVINQTFVLDARGGITTPELLQYVNDTARENATQAAGASYAAGQQSAPGTLNKFTQLRG